MAIAERPGMESAAAPAGFGRRVGAYVLDWLVGFILTCLFAAAAGLALLRASDMGGRDPSDRAIYTALVIALAVVPAWAALTWAGWTWSGQSVGKVAMNLRIVGPAGRSPGPGRAVVRLIVYMAENALLVALLPMLAVALLFRSRVPAGTLIVIMAAALIIPAFSAVLALRGPTHRALHDRVAGTTVIAE